MPSPITCSECGHECSYQYGWDQNKFYCGDCWRKEWVRVRMSEEKGQDVVKQYQGQSPAINSKTFLERWNALGLERRILALLISAVRRAGGSLILSMGELDSIQAGESLISLVKGGCLELQDAPEQAELLTIHDPQPRPNAYAGGANQWKTQNSDYYGGGEQVAQQTRPLSDQELADLEDRMNAVKSQAMKARRTPLRRSNEPPQ